MPTRRFALERGAPKRLSVSWGRHGLRVFLDDLELPATGPGGRDFRLPDGRPLAVDVDGETGEVDVICDGAFLPGTRFDPHHQLLIACVTLWVFGALHVVPAFLPIAEWFPSMEGVPIGAASLGLAVFYVLAGVAVSRRSAVLLYLSAAVVAVEAVALSILLFVAGVEKVKLFLFLFLPLLPLSTGFSALEEIAIEEGEGRT